MPVGLVQQIDASGAVVSPAKEAGGNLAAVATAAGAPADAAYAGSGSAGIVGLLKGLYAKLAAALATKDAVYTPAAPSGATTIATGGTAQVLCAAGEITRGGMLRNPPTAPGMLYYSLVTTSVAGAEGGTTFGLLPGESAALPPSTLPVWVRSATTGHVFCAWVN